MTVESEYLQYCLKFSSGVFFFSLSSTNRYLAANFKGPHSDFQLYLLLAPISQRVKKTEAGTWATWGWASSFKVTFGSDGGWQIWGRFYPSSVLFCFVSFLFSTNGFPSLRKRCSLHREVKIKSKYFRCFSLKNISWVLIPPMSFSLLLPLVLGFISICY